MKEYLKKRQKMKEQNLKYDFLPPMLEIIEKPENRAAELILCVVTLLILSTIVWAYYMKLDVVVSCSGMMIPENGVVTIQSEYAGLVSSVEVAERMHVNQGDPILCIDPTNQQMGLESLQYELDVLETQKEVYQMIYEGRAEEIDPTTFGINKSIAEAILLEYEMEQNKLSGYEIQLSIAESDNKAWVSNEMESASLEYQLSVVQNINSLDVKITSKEMEIEEAKFQMDSMTVKAPVSGTITELQ